MSHEEWVEVNLPKVAGTWNLHKALAEQRLDFFFMSSSTVTIHHVPGQGNYNAANTFLEAFCQYRHSLGLPASVLNVCPIDDVGFVAENPAARKALKAQGHYFLREQDFLDCLHLSLVNSQSPANATRTKLSNQQPLIPSPWVNTGQIIMGLRPDLHLADPKTRNPWSRDRRMGIYHNIKKTKTVDHPASNNQLKQFLLHCVEDPDLLSEQDSEYLLAREIGLKVFSLILKDTEGLDVDMTLSNIGVDSLIAIQLRRWWKQAFGLKISVLEIIGLGTIRELGKVAAQRLKVKLEGTES